MIYLCNTPAKHSLCIPLAIRPITTETSFMISLIITIISIALVAALALATLYYGASLYTESQARAEAATLVNQGQQLMSAAILYRVERGAPAPSLQALVDANYITNIPSPPARLQSASLGKVSLISEAYAADTLPTWTWDSSTETLAVVKQVGADTVCEQVNAIGFDKPEIRFIVDTALPVQCYGAAAPYTVVLNSQAQPDAPPLTTQDPHPLCVGTVNIGHIPDQCGSNLIASVPPNAGTSGSGAAVPPAGEASVPPSPDVLAPVIVNPKGAYGFDNNSNGTIHVELGYGWNVFTVQYPTNLDYYCPTGVNTENVNCIGFGSGPYRLLSGEDWYYPEHTWMGDLFTYTWGPVLKANGGWQSNPLLQCDAAYLYQGDNALMNYNGYLTSAMSTPYAPVSQSMSVTIVCHVPKPFVDYIYGNPQPLTKQQFASDELHWYMNSDWNLSRQYAPNRPYSMDEAVYQVPAGTGYQRQSYPIWVSVKNGVGNAGNGSMPSYLPDSGTTAKLSGSSAILDFGSVAKWSAASSLTLTVTNSGQADIRLMEVAQTNTANTFIIEGGTCTWISGNSGSLAPGETCTVTVGLRTGAAGTFSTNVLLRGFTSANAPVTMLTPVKGDVTGGGVSSITLAGQCWNTNVTVPFPDGIMPAEASSLSTGRMTLMDNYGNQIGACGVDSFNSAGYAEGWFQSWNLFWGYQTVRDVWSVFPSTAGYKVSCHVLQGTPAGTYWGQFISNYAPETAKIPVTLGSGTGNGGCGDTP